jgi:hypothetical protein
MKNLLCFSVAALLINTAAFASPLEETRYCTIEPVRTETGRIARRTDVLVAFRKIHPCPSTGSRFGACPGWNIDHVVPLAVGGCDSVSNLQWLPVGIKRCAGNLCKDRWERRVYLRRMM